MPTSRAATRIARRVFANSKAEEVHYNQLCKAKERAKQEEAEREEIFRTTGRLVSVCSAPSLRGSWELQRESGMCGMSTCITPSRTPPYA